MSRPLEFSTTRDRFFLTMRATPKVSNVNDNRKFVESLPLRGVIVDNSQLSSRKLSELARTFGHVYQLRVLDRRKS